jgi:hypothetical protein
MSDRKVGITQLREFLAIAEHEHLLRGADFAGLEESTKYSIASRVSEFLRFRTDTMLQFTPEQLIADYINNKQAVAIVHNGNSELLGFAKNYHWPGKNAEGQNLYEFGSWVVPDTNKGNGCGYKLALLACATAQEQDPGSQLVAVCATSNMKPINILTNLGALEIEKPINLKLLLGGGATPVKILDMTRLQHLDLVNGNK